MSPVLERAAGTRLPLILPDLSLSVSAIPVASSTANTAIDLWSGPSVSLSSELPQDYDGPRALARKDLGWSEEYARQVRGLFLTTDPDDWDDPKMDIYDWL